MALTKNDIAVIIVNYKGWTYLKDCLEPLVAIKLKSLKLEVLVVDNCSDDGQLELFKNQFKSVKFFKNTGNNGFANACNFGAKQSNANCLLFLNPDTIADYIAIESLFTYTMNHPKIGALSCKQINQKGQYYNFDNLFLKPKTMFGFFRIFYRWFNKKALKKRFNPNQNIVYPDWISGSVICMSKLWFDKIGGFDEDYWMYYEDVDLCKRLTKAGGKIALLNTACIKHYHGGSSRINYAVKAMTKSEVIISRHVYINKHFTGINRFMMQFSISMVQIISKIIQGVLGLLFFAKAIFYRNIAKEILKYYFGVLIGKGWLSHRSVNFK